MESEEQPLEHPARCLSSSDVPPLFFESKGVDFRRFRHVDPRYSVYRWDCGSYPYFKTPVPISAPCSGLQPAFKPTSLRHPDHVPSAPDIFCDGRRDCYGGGVVGGGNGSGHEQDFMPQPQRCICPDPRDISPYHPPHLGPDALNWDCRSAGCLCCDQHVVNARGPSSHSRHVDSVRLFPPVYRAARPDVVLVHPATRELIDARPADGAPVQCLSSKSESLSMGLGPELWRGGCTGQPMQNTTGQISSSSATSYTTESELTGNRDSRQSTGGPECKTDASLESRCSASTDPAEEKSTGAMKTIGALTNEEPKQPAEPPIGKIPDAKITPTRSTSKVTPLYGLPSWWGDEPEPDFSQPRHFSHYNHPAVTSTSNDPLQRKQTEHSVAIAMTRTTISKSSNPPPLTTKGCLLGPTEVPTVDSFQSPITGHIEAQGHTHCQSNNNLDNCPTSFENPGPHKNNSKSPSSKRNPENASCLGTFEMSAFESSPEHFESPSSFQNLKISGHHSPPERDRPSSIDGQVRQLQPHFVYPVDQLLPVPVERDFRLVTYSDDCSSLKCKAPTAFIVDFHEVDRDDNSRRRITVKTSLRQFLPPRCERSLQRRLSWMKQNRRLHSATERGERRRENEDPGDIVTDDSRQRFRLSQTSSFKDSFEEAVASDVIADDVSEAGTYTIDVSSDGESMAVADARERILATFGITGIEDAELDRGEWPESGKSYFEDNWDKDCFKKDESLKAKTNHRPTTLCDNDKVVGESRSNGTADPVTPTAESYTWSFSEASSAPLLLKNDLAAQEDIVLTIYTEAATICSIPTSDALPESHGMSLHQNVNDTSRRLQSIDTAVLLAESEWSSKSGIPRERRTTDSTTDPGHRSRLDPEAVVDSSSRRRTDPRNDRAEVCLTLESNNAGAFLTSTSIAASESGKMILPTDCEYFKIPASFYSEPVSSLGIGVRASGTSEKETPDPGIALRRRSTTASESGDSLESPRSMTKGSKTSENTTLANQASAPASSPMGNNLFCDPVRDSDCTIKRSDYGIPSTNAIKLHNCDNSSDVINDSDEDGSPVDPLHDLLSVRNADISTMDITLKPAEESVQLLASKKASTTTGKYIEENRKVSHQSTVTESESPAAHTEIPDRKPLTSGSGPKIQSTLPAIDGPVASKHPKTKPPTPKSFPKSPSLPDGQLSARRCFSDLDVANHDESSSETSSPLVSSGKGTGGKGASNSVEHTRMNRTFALRCARREASGDGSDAHRAEQQPQRSAARTTKKGSGSKFEDVQRSRSASRSRPGGACSRSLFESPRSAEASVNLGQRVVRKSQENDKKARQTSTTDSGGAVSRSLTRDDEVTSQKSSATFRPPNATRTSKKKSLTSERGKEDVPGGASGTTVKGSPVQQRPLSSSLAPQEAAANEWTRRKKYNPRQSLQTDASPKKTGKPDGKPVLANVDKTEYRPRNRKKAADSSGKNAPSTSSDWTDDEKLQLTPRGRDLPAVCQLSAKVKLLSDQVLQALRKRPEFKANEVILQSPKQASSDADSLENTSPEFLYIFHNLEAAERQMSAAFKVLSTHS